MKYVFIIKCVIIIFPAFQWKMGSEEISRFLPFRRKCFNLNFYYLIYMLKRWGGGREGGGGGGGGGEKEKLQFDFSSHRYAELL